MGVTESWTGFHPFYPMKGVVLWGPWGPGAAFDLSKSHLCLACEVHLLDLGAII